MNAKELRAAAESRLNASDGVMQLIGATDADLEADIEGIGLKIKQDRACYCHILATVREDDDEPVTEEWRGSVTVGQTLNTIIFISDIEDHPRIGGCKTRGQFRSLCRGLGIELKEVDDAN